MVIATRVSSSMEFGKDLEATSAETKKKNIIMNMLVSGKIILERVSTHKFNLFTYNVIYLFALLIGKGKCFYYNGDLYVGNWKHGKRHGYGDHFYRKGERYTGDWK